MESKIMATILNSKGVNAGYVTPTPQAPRREWACADSDPDLFFPENEATFVEAQKLCATCDLRAVCRSLGQARQESGVWGGVLLVRGKPIAAVPVIGRPRKAA